MSTIKLRGAKRPSAPASCRPALRPLMLALAAALTAGASAPAGAGDWFWAGNGTDGSWSKAANWTPQGGSTLPNLSDGNTWLHFKKSKISGNNTHFPTNGYTNDVRGIVFDADAEAMTATQGARIYLNEGINNNSAKLQTFNTLVQVYGEDSNWEGGSAGMSFAAVMLGNAEKYPGSQVSLTLKNKVKVDNFNLALYIPSNLDSVKSSVSVIGKDATHTLSLQTGSEWKSNGTTLGALALGIGTVNVDGAGSRLVNAAPTGTPLDLQIGVQGDGYVNVRNGGAVSSLGKTVLGGQALSRGAAMLDGAGSTWASGADLTVGQAGTGTLDILNGAVVSSVNSFLGAALNGGGYASLYGAGSAWNHSGDLAIGQVGSGYLSVEAGGVVRNVNASLGRMAGSDGFAKVSGVQSRWISSGDLNVGYVGDGSLSILDGGQVSSDVAYIGREGGIGLVTLAGTGSGLDVAKEIWLTRGALNIGAGAVVNARNLLAGSYPVNGAAATVAGAGAKLILAEQLFLGGAGAGALTVGSGGLVQAQNLVIGAAGTLTLAGGTLNIAQASHAGRFVWTAGNLGFSGDAALGAGQLLGTDMSLLAGMNLAVAGRLTLGTDDALTLAGGQAQVGTLVQGGLLSVARFSTLTVGAGGLSNLGELSFEGGTIGGSGALINSGYMSGFGRKSGSGAFINSGLFEQSGGVFELANTTLNVNTGNWDMLGGRELRLSGANLFNAGVMSMSGDTVSGSATLINSTAGTLTGRGVIAARFENAGRLTVDAGSFRIEPAFRNDGQILMGSTTATLAGGPITNTGRINGVGQINNEIINTGSVGALGGTLTLDGRLTNTGILSAGPGATLLLNQGLASNAGKIQLAGGTLDNNGKAMTNEALGVISGFGTLSGGTLTNKGRVLLSGGSSTVYTEILGASASQIILSGLSNTSFYGKVDVQSGAELRVSAGSVATFFELVQQRTGAKFTGTGTKRYEGGISAGSSPGLGTDEGDVEFGDDNLYLAEIGGLSACTLLCGTDDGLKNRSFDKYIVDGNLSLGGTLKLVSWNGFEAHAGQRFDLLDWGSLTGRFGSIDASGLKLAAGSALDYSQLYTSGTISVTTVPEPASLALWLAGLGALVTWARRRRTMPLRH